MMMASDDSGVTVPSCTLRPLSGDLRIYQVESGEDRVLDLGHVNANARPPMPPTVPCTFR